MTFTDMGYTSTQGVGGAGVVWHRLDVGACALSVRHPGRTATLGSGREQRALPERKR